MADGISDYDAFAFIYNRHWGPQYVEKARETLHSLLLPQMPATGTILDLCCGAGHISRILTDRGFDVVGLDASASLVELARRNTPAARFEVADAKSFRSPERFQAAICLNDSLNHLLQIADLKAAFLNVHQCLVPGGAFVFDLNFAQKYQNAWAGSFAIVDEDAVCSVIAKRDMQQRLATFDATVFRPAGKLWARKDIHLLQTWYSPDEVRAALVETGFADVRLTDRTGTSLTGESFDKAFFSCKNN